MTYRTYGSSLAAAGLAVAGLFLTAGGASAAPPPHSQHFNLVTAAKDVTFLGEHELTGGDYTAQWKMFGGDTITVAGAQNSTVEVTQTLGQPGSGSLAATVMPPAAVKAASAQQLVAAYAAAGKSVVTDALAVGYTPAQAAALAPASTGIHPAIAGGTPMYAGCVSVTGDAGNAWGKACDNQKMMEDLGGGHWWLGDSVTGSGSDNDWADHLEAVAAYVNYGSGNSIQNYQPTGSTSFTGCGQSRTWTVRVAGQSVSSTTVDCPGSLDPYGLPSSTEFGTKFNACDSGNQVDGVASDDWVDNPSNAAPGPDISSQIWWGNC